MTPEYSLDPDNLCLTVIPLDGVTVVTQEGDPGTVMEPAAGELPKMFQVETPQTDLSLATHDCETTLSEEPRTEPANSEAPSFESLIELVMEAADSVRELMVPCLTAHGLNDARFTIMRAIRGSKNGECSQSELARCLKQSEANVSTLLDRMRGDVLVSREKSPFDRRRSVVRLTDKGQQQLALTERDYQVRAQGVLRAFDVFEIQSFRDQLSSFIAIWETELEHVASNNAVAGRIGDSTESNTEGTETRHAQAG